MFTRVVFDTSTLVSAALRVGSVPHSAMIRAFAESTVCASVSTLDELEQVLLRSKFDRYQPPEVRNAFIAILRRHISLFAVSEANERDVNPPCRDPKDNKFLALIQASDADALISSDADLLVLHPWHEVPILTPAQFYCERSLVEEKHPLPP